MTKIILLIAFALGCFSIVSAQNLTLWECNRCHQQYQGNNPPYFTKCPATNNTQTHWWIRKR
jgi:hypothetical protein